MLGLASWRSAATPGFGWKRNNVGLAVFDHRNGGSCIFQPSGGTTTTTASTSGQSFQCQDRLFKLFALEPQLSKHFIDVQNISLLRHGLQLHDRRAFGHSHYVSVTLRDLAEV